MFDFIKRLFKKEPPPLPRHYKVYKECNEYQDVIVSHWPFSAKELKEWQDQYDKPYNPLNVDISICIPGGYVNRDGDVIRRIWKNTADRHGEEEKPNGD